MQLCASHHHALLVQHRSTTSLPDDFLSFGYSVDIRHSTVSWSTLGTSCRSYGTWYRQKRKIFRSHLHFFKPNCDLSFESIKCHNDFIFVNVTLRYVTFNDVLLRFQKMLRELFQLFPGLRLIGTSAHGNNPSVISCLSKYSVDRSKNESILTIEQSCCCCCPLAEVRGVERFSRHDVFFGLKYTSHI